MSADCIEPRVTVVVPVYNGAETLPLCLAALRQQTAAPAQYEVIVVDDGSTDGSAEIAQRNDVRIVRQAHRGAASARNAGIAAARGELVLFTDADCEPAADWIERMTETLDNPTIAGVRGAYRTRQTGIVPRFVQLEYQDRYDRVQAQAAIDFVDTYAAAYRRSVLIAAGGFNESLPGAAVEDVELSYRLAEHGHRMVFNPRAIVYHRHPRTLWQYLRRKANYGYWRVPVYARFPTKIGGDSHTPSILRLQMVLAAASLACWPWLIWIPVLRWIWAGILVVFAVTTLPFLAKASSRDAALAPLCPALLWMRALAVGLGLAGGVLRLTGSRLGRRWTVFQQANSPANK